MGAGDVTLTAQWTLSAVDAIDFNPEGGSSMVSVMYGTDGTTITLPGAPYYPGYTFDGWFAAPSGGSVLTSPYTLTGSTTLYAQWTANTFTVAFDNNGGSGTMADESYSSGSSQALSANTFTNTGYTFLGWNTALDGSGAAYSDQQAVTLYETQGSTVTLFAQWTAISYSVTYLPGGGTGAVPVQGNLTYHQDLDIAGPQSLTRTGYTFAGWNDGTTTYQEGDTVLMGAGDVTLTAQWTINSYSVVYRDGSGGRGNPPTQANVNYGGSFTVAGQGGVTRTGYTFAGWSDGTSTYYPNDTYAIGVSNVTLTAQWTAIPYTVTYADGGGTGTAPTQANVNYGGTFSVASQGSVTRTGYTFAGWNDGTSNYLPKDTYFMGAGDVTLTAQWTANTFNVAFDNNGGLGMMSNQSFTSGVAQNLTANSFTNGTDTFGGWNTESDGSGDSYSDQQFVTLYETQGSTLTLYAQWVPAGTASVTYYAVDADGSTPTAGSAPVDGSSPYTLGSNVIVLDNVGTTPLSLTGYTFGGWCTTDNSSDPATCSGTVYDPNALIFNIQSNVSLYAFWVVDTYNVTYEATNADGSSPTTGVAPVDGSSPYPGALR